MLTPQEKKRRELVSLIEAYGVHRIASICRVHRTTVSRWVKGQVPVPEPALLAIRALVVGQRPGYDRSWDGWIFRDGFLWSPEGYQFEPGEIRAWIYNRRLIKSQQERIRELEAKLVKMTQAASLVDQAANDLAIWPGDPRSTAFEKKKAP